MSHFHRRVPQAELVPLGKLTIDEENYAESRLLFSLLSFAFFLVLAEAFVGRILI